MPFTDAAKCPFAIGSSEVENANVLIRYGLPSWFSVFSAELTAIQQKVNTCTICTNSASTIQSVLSLNTCKQHPQ